MKLEYDIVSIIDLLGVLQGIIVGLILLLQNKARDKSKFFLASFIISFALALVHGLMMDFGFLAMPAAERFIPFSFNWLLFPLFYLYVQSVSVLSIKLSYWVLKWALGFLVLETILFFIEWGGVILPNFMEPLVMATDICFGIFVGIKIMACVNRHFQEVNNQYSEVRNKELLWAKWYAIIGMVYTVLGVPVFLICKNEMVYLVFSALNIGLLYWVSFHGVFQKEIESLIGINTFNGNKGNKELNEKPTSKFILDVEMKEIITKAKEYLIRTEAFMKPDLTIQDVSIALGIHPKRISTSINQQLGINFNAYINNYRVDKAVELLLNEAYSHLSINGIGNEVGFRSKASFYAAFKKKKNTTPNRFKMKN